MNSPFVLTPRAVERFAAHYGFRLPEQAKWVLERVAAASHFTKQLETGEWLYRSPRPWRARLVVAPAEDGGAPPVVVTVLPEHDGAYSGPKQTFRGRA